MGGSKEKLLLGGVLGEDGCLFTPAECDPGARCVPAVGRALLFRGSRPVGVCQGSGDTSEGWIVTI